MRSNFKSGYHSVRMRMTKPTALFIAVAGLLSILISFRNLQLMTYYQKPKVCFPQRNVLFLKTHKTASSSVQNIFMRYADRRNLMLALPMMINYFGHPEKFTKDMVPMLEPPNEYNILTHHARFNYHTMSQFMPKNSTFVTILRDPATAFESLYQYYQLEIFYNATITSYLENERVANRTRFGGKIGYNQMAFDLGIDEDLFEDDDALLRAAQLLDEQFDLVMIAELMNESLVLLKDELCWSTEDMVTFKHNARSDLYKENLGPDLIENLRRINRADQLIYDYFYGRLKERVNDFGARKMRLEVEKLQRATDQLYQKCVKKPDKPQFDDDYEMIQSLKLNTANQMNRECEHLVKSEMNFTKQMFDKQMKHLRYGEYLRLSILINEFFNK